MRYTDVIGKGRPHPAGPTERYCTFAVTVAGPFSVNVQLLTLPGDEQAPEKIASRPPDTLSVIEVPTPNDAEPVLPVATSMPTGVLVMRTPLRPVAVTVRVAVCGGGGGGGGGAAGDTVRTLPRDVPPYPALMVAAVVASTTAVEKMNTAFEAPGATVTLAGTLASVGSLLANDTAAPAAGACPDSVTTP